MVNFYRQKLYCYRDGIQIRGYTVELLAEDTDPSLAGVPETKVTWGDLPDFYFQNGLWAPFDVYNTKKGQKIVYFDCSRATKEWKESETGISYSTAPAILCKASLQEIMENRNSDLAIKYLVERGMSILAK